MNLDLNLIKAKNYTNNSQIARILTENWVKENGYCPNCGESYLIEFENNKPVADFYCNSCTEQYELKSKNGEKIGNKIVDGAYLTMIDRISSNQNPSFFLLTYDKSKWRVNNFLIIPKHYFIPDIIEKRKPLSSFARRAGWIGCNINLTKVPENGRIYLVKNSNVIPKENVYSKWQRTDFLKQKSGESKEWLLDIMNCIDAIDKETFSLKDVYLFEDQLKLKHPNNNFVRDKIRQKLQVLRNKGVIEFKNRGTYKKINL